MVDLERVVAIVQSVKNAKDMEQASVSIIALLEEKQAALAEVGRLAIELRKEKLCYEDQFNTGMMLDGQRNALYSLAKRIVSDRACVCNDPEHRCGTNQMLEDIEAIMNSTSSDTGKDSR